MRVELLDPTSDPEWDRQVMLHGNVNAFHSAAWSRVLTATYGHSPAYLRFSKDGKILALVPLMEVRSFLRARRGISLPFSDFCDALFVNPSCSDVVFARLREIAEERGWRYLELRGGGCVPPSATPAVSFYSHELDLRRGYQEIKMGFRPSVRQALRRAHRGEVKACVDHSEEGMRIFYALHVQTRRRHGVPPQSLSFFLNIHREIIQRGMGFVVLVQVKERPISAMVFFQWGKTGIYKFGASDKSFQELRPNNLGMATGIKSLADAGSETLLFGRSSLSNAGLRRFKLSWGASEKMLQYYRYRTDCGDWGRTYDRTEGVHTEIFRRLPSSLNRLAGALIYSHLD